MCEMMSAKDRCVLSAIVESKQDLPEREYSLLGQKFLHFFDSISFGESTFYFSERDFPITEGWGYIETMSGIIRRMVMSATTVPDDFEAWVDDEPIFSGETLLVQDHDDCG